MIMESLTLLASLRPRRPDGTTPAVIPPVPVLRVLQQTLPAEPSPGWYGTLSESRGLAVRDDTTLRLKGPLEIIQSIIAAAGPNATATATAATTSTTQSPAPPYSSNYTYAAFQQHYRGAQAQTPGYHGSTYSHTPATPQVQAMQAPYQTHAQYGGSNQYPYSSWFQNQAAVGSAVATPTPGSRKGTPGPATANPTYLPYSASGVTASATPARAVANTIPAKPAANGWSTTGAVPATPSPVGAYTLPPHLRTTVAATPSNPQGSATALAAAAQSFLTGYQAPATTAPSAST